MRGDSSVRSSVSHMAMGDVMWRLVTAMLVTYGTSAVARPSWCCGDALTESASPLPHWLTHPIFVPRITSPRFFHLGNLRARNLVLSDKIPDKTGEYTQRLLCTIGLSNYLYRSRVICVLGNFKGCLFKVRMIISPKIAEMFYLRGHIFMGVHAYC